MLIYCLLQFLKKKALQEFSSYYMLFFYFQLTAATVLKVSVTHTGAPGFHLNSQTAANQSISNDYLYLPMVITVTLSLISVMLDNLYV